MRDTGSMLVVDDDPFTAGLLADALAGIGWEVLGPAADMTEARVGSFGVADPDLGPRWEPSEIASSWLLWMEVNGEPISRDALVDDLVAVGFSADEAAEAVESLGLDGLVERLKQDGFEPDVATEQRQLALSDTSPVNSDAPSKAAENAAREMAAWLAQENVGGAWYSRQWVIEIFVDPTGTFGYGLVEATRHGGSNSRAQFVHMDHLIRPDLHCSVVSRGAEDRDPATTSRSQRLGWVYS